MTNALVSNFRGVLGAISQSPLLNTLSMHKVYRSLHVAPLDEPLVCRSGEDRTSVTGELEHNRFRVTSKSTPQFALKTRFTPVSQSLLYQKTTPGLHNPNLTV